MFRKNKNKHIKFHCEEDRLLFEIAEKELAKEYGLTERWYLKPILIILFITAVILSWVNNYLIAKELLIILIFVLGLAWLNEKALHKKEDSRYWELIDLIHDLDKVPTLRAHITTALDSIGDYDKIRYEEAVSLGKIMKKRRDKKL